MKAVKYLLLTLNLLFSTIIYGQNFNYRMLSPIEISPSDELRCIYFDHQGLMWIGTNSGLKSYNGYSMTTYKSDAFSPGILPNNTVLCITEDNNNRLWIGTRNGLVRMDKRTGEFHTYFLPKENQRIIYSLYTSSDGTIWIGTDEGLSYYNSKKSSFYTFDNTNTYITHPDGKRTKLGAYSVKNIIEDNKGNIFFGTWANGLIRFEKGSREFYQYKKFNKRNSAYSLHFDKIGRLWIGTWGYGIVRLDNPYNTKNPKEHQYPFKTNNFDTFYKIIEDPITNTMWACSREGISILNSKDVNGTWKNYTSAGTNNLNFSNDIATNGNGNIWISTLNYGIIEVNTNPSLFNIWNIDTKSYKFSINAICSIYTQNGNDFWLGLNPYGLALYNRTTGKTIYSNNIPGLKDIPTEVMGTKIPSIIKRSNGEMWFASSSYGIMVKKTDGKAYIINYQKHKYIADNYVCTLFESKDKTMWIGQRSGISIVYPNNKGALLRPHDAKRDFSQCDVRNIIQTRNGDVWLSTENEGIIRIRGNIANPKSIRFKQYNPLNGNYAIDDATACYEDSRGILWAISNSGGLFRYYNAKDCFIPINREYHIDGDRVFSINEDNNHNLWLTTDYALVKLSIKKNTYPEVTSFASEDGIGEMMFSPNSSYKYNGELFFGGRTGFFSFTPSKWNRNKQKNINKNISITDILINDIPYIQLDSAKRREISDENPAYTRTITIPSDIKKFGIEFALLTYSNAKQNKYAYKLEGYDKEWTYTNYRGRRATYQNLPWGNYYLHIKAADSFGKWHEMDYAIKIMVLPPWWAKWWAYIIYVFIVGLGVIFGIRWYKNYLKTKNRLQMTVVFTNITHELLTPLTVITAAVDELRNKAPQFDDSYTLMQNNVSRLTRLLRQILEIRKSQAGQLKLLVSKNNIAAFIRDICESIRPMSSIHHNNLIVNIPQNEIFAWFDTDKIDKILFNILSNAFKYNRDGGNVTVALETKNGKAILKVSDEGIGISPDKLKHLYTRFLDGDYRKMKTLGTGIGLSLTHDLVKLHHGDINCESKSGIGTTFIISIPIRKEDYNDKEIYKEKETIEKTQITYNHESEVTLKDTLHTRELQPGDGYKILLVEDNEQLLNIMKRLLGRRYHVATAKNGVQALNIINKEELDIVVTDVMMPVMDGIELTKKIKASKDFAQLPVIMLTAKTSDTDENTGYETGADDYITKPFKLENLQLRIDSIIANRMRIREKFRQQTEIDQIDDMHYSNPDKTFIEKAMQCVRQNMTDTEYNRATFASDMMMSSSSLYNKLRALTGQGIIEFINSIRLKEACSIIKRQPDIQINDIAMKVGFNTPKYFSKCFKKEFGMSPKDYAQKNINGSI
jgi:ligand-binding sensor domain-containing protein/DNA-binding response OmpR family regulator/two-component sensor histidine kinase